MTSLGTPSERNARAGFPDRGLAGVLRGRYGASSSDRLRVERSVSSSSSSSPRAVEARRPRLLRASTAMPSDLTKSLPLARAPLRHVRRRDLRARDRRDPSPIDPETDRREYPRPGAAARCGARRPPRSRSASPVSSVGPRRRRPRAVHLAGGSPREYAFTTSRGAERRPVEPLWRGQAFHSGRCAIIFRASPRVNVV